MGRERERERGVAIALTVHMNAFHTIVKKENKKVKLRGTPMTTALKNEKYTAEEEQKRCSYAHTRCLHMFHQLPSVSSEDDARIEKEPIDSVQMCVIKRCADLFFLLLLYIF